MSMNIHTHLSHFRTIPPKKAIYFNSRHIACHPEGLSKQVGHNLGGATWGARCFGKNRDPQPGKLVTTGGDSVREILPGPSRK